MTFKGRGFALSFACSDRPLHWGAFSCKLRILMSAASAAITARSESYNAGSERLRSLSNGRSESPI